MRKEYRQQGEYGKHHLAALFKANNALYAPTGSSYPGRFVICAATFVDNTVLHAKTPPYALKGRSGGILHLHVKKKWLFLVDNSPWKEEVDYEIECIGGLTLAGENDASVSIRFKADSNQAYIQNESILGPIDHFPLAEGDTLDIRASDLKSLLTNASASFGAYRLDDWPQNPAACRVPFFDILAIGNEDPSDMASPLIYSLKVASLLPGGENFPGVERKNIDPSSARAFFQNTPKSFPGYRYSGAGSESDADYSLAIEPKPVKDGGIGPIRPGLYYKGGKCVAIITGSFSGAFKGTLPDGGGSPNYTRVSSTEGIVTYCAANWSPPTEQKTPEEVTGSTVNGWQRDFATTHYIRHYFHEVSAPGATSGDGQQTISFAITITIHTGGTPRQVDSYRKLTIPVSNLTKTNAEPGSFQVNIGSEDEPNIVTLIPTTDDEGKKVIEIDLDKGLLKIEDYGGILCYEPGQKVAVKATCTYESSGTAGSFRTAPDDQLDFDEYRPYTIADLGIRTANGYLPR